MSYFGSRATEVPPSDGSYKLVQGRFLPLLRRDVHRARSAAGGDPDEAPGLAAHPPRGERAPPPGRSPRVRTEHEKPGVAVAHELDHRPQRAQARDPQELGPDAQRGGAVSRRTDLVELLLVREGRV